MGDLFSIDEYTAALLDTLEKLGLYKVEVLRSMGFGAPTQLLMSPLALESFKKSFNGKK